MNGLQTLTQWKHFFGNPEGAILGMMNSIYPLGKVIALFLVTYVSDRWGRKLPIFIGLVACIGFAIMQGLAQNLATFVTARALLGFFTSFLSQPSPVVIAELAYPTQRGKVTALYNTFFVSHSFYPIRRHPNKDTFKSNTNSSNSTSVLFSRPGVPSELSRFNQLGAGEFLLYCKGPCQSYNYLGYIFSPNLPGITLPPPRGMSAVT